jgi:PAS domain S-box-containing protein
MSNNSKTAPNEMVGNSPRNSRRGAGVFFVALILLIASVVLIYQPGLVIIRTNRETTAALRALQTLEDFASSLKDTETGQRGYLLTGEEAYLKPYTNGLSQVQTNVAALRELASAGNLPKDRIEHVAGLTQQKLAELDRTIQQRRKNGLDAALAIVRSNQGEQLMDQIRNEVSQLESGVRKDFFKATQNTSRATTIRNITFLGVFLLNLLFLFWASRTLSRQTSRRESAISKIFGQQELLGVTLRSIGDAVIATDEEGRVTFMNPVAEELIGAKQQEVSGQKLSDIFKIINELTRQVVENPVARVLREGTVVGLANHTILISKNGSERPIDDSAAPIRDADGNLIGVVLVFRDAGKQRAAELTSRRLTSIIENSEDAIITKDLNGVVTSWNPGAQRIFGYTADEMIGQPISILIPPDHLDEEPRILDNIRHGRRVKPYETVRRRKDGSLVDISLCVSPLKVGDTIVGASKIARDITEQRRAQEELRQSEARLGVTLASIGDAVISTDKNGRVAFMNAVAEQLTGWNQREAIGVPLDNLFKIVNEFTRKTVENPVTRVLREGVIVGLANHTILISKNGSERPIDDSAAPIRDAKGDLIGVVLVFRDATNQRETERNALRFRLAVEAAPNGMVMVDEHGTITMVNTQMERLFGYSSSEMLGQPIEMLLPERYRPGHPALREGFFRSPQTRAMGHGRELFARRKNGSEFPVEIGLNPAGMGNEKFVLAAVIDITERKQMEQELIKAHSDLEDYARNLEATIAERTANLQRTVADLEAFSFTISHDLRSPLRAIQGFAHFLLEDYADKFDSRGRDYLERIKNSAERQDKLILEALTYSRIGRSKISIEPINLNKLIEDVLQTYPDIQAHRAEITIERPLHSVMGSHASLVQCVSNLLANAVKFVPAGSRAQVRIRTEKRDSKVRLLIEDKGIGIPENLLSKIFEPFQRAHPNAGFEGTGMGLAIVRKATLRMDGAVGVQSEVGRGSTFWIELPAADEVKNRG